MQFVLFLDRTKGSSLCWPVVFQAYMYTPFIIILNILTLTSSHLPACPSTLSSHQSILLAHVVWRCNVPCQSLWHSIRSSHCFPFLCSKWTISAHVSHHQGFSSAFSILSPWKPVFILLIGNTIHEFWSDPLPLLGPPSSSLFPHYHIHTLLFYHSFMSSFY